MAADDGGSSGRRAKEPVSSVPPGKASVGRDSKLRLAHHALYFGRRTLSPQLTETCGLSSKTTGGFFFFFFFFSFQTVVFHLAVSSVKVKAFAKKKKKPHRKDLHLRLGSQLPELWREKLFFLWRMYHFRCCYCCRCYYYCSVDVATVVVSVAVLLLLLFYWKSHSLWI